MSSVTSVGSDKNELSISWEKKASKCQRELLVKKVATTIIGLANLAGIAILFIHITLHIPIATSPLLVSPFIVGVIGALSYLKLPTLGMTPANYKNYSNPAVLAAKGVTLVLFGPLILMIKRIDWTNYGDPFIAKNIVKDLNEEEGYKAIEVYGPNASNLARYGFISKQHAERFSTLYNESKSILKTRAFLIAENATEELSKIQFSLDKTKNGWKGFQQDILQNLPIISPNPPDFSNWTSPFRAFIRKVTGIYVFSSMKLSKAS